MKCFNCSAEIPDNTQSCPGCGADQGFSQELIDRARANDQAAITELYNKTYSGVYYSVKALIKDEDAALDILQDSYIKAFKSLDQLKEPCKFSSWVKQIAHNRSIDYLRKAKPLLFSEMESEDGDMPLEFEDTDIDNMPEAVIDRDETSRLISEILNDLPDEQRAVISMFYYEQLSVKEIADELGVSENTVKSRLNYGRKKIETKVLDLEKKGTKLYGLSPIPFLLLLFKTQSAQIAAAAPAVSADILAACSAEAAASAAAAGTAASSGSAATAGAAAAKTGIIAALKASVGAKIIAGVVAAGIVAGTVGAVIAVNNTPAPEVDPRYQDYLDCLLNETAREKVLDYEQAIYPESAAFVDLTGDGLEEFILMDRTPDTDHGNLWLFGDAFYMYGKIYGADSGRQTCLFTACDKLYLFIAYTDISRCDTNMLELTYAEGEEYGDYKRRIADDAEAEAARNDPSARVLLATVPPSEYPIFGLSSSTENLGMSYDEAVEWLNKKISGK